MQIAHIFPGFQMPFRTFFKLLNAVHTHFFDIIKHRNTVFPKRGAYLLVMVITKEHGIAKYAAKATGVTPIYLCS